MKSTRIRRWLIRIVAVIAAPLLVLGLIEGVLWLAGYGEPTGFLVRNGDRWQGNERFGWRFFPRALSRSPAKFSVAVTKEPGTYRVVILGESAAMGTPDPAFGLGRMLEGMLRAQSPLRNVEVINAAMTAISSHAVLEIARDCAKLQPDLVVVYMGNNEVVGPFGPGTVFGGYSPSRMLIRASLWTKSLRLGQLLENSIGRTVRGTQPEAWRGMEMFVENRVARDDPRLARVYENFRANLRDICAVSADAGAKVVVSTVAVNLRDNPPFASLHRAGLAAGELQQWETHFRAGNDLEKSGDPSGALAAYSEAARIDGEFAELRFRMARCGGSGEEYSLARDLDALRFRADSRINGIIWESKGVIIADAERAFAEASAAGEPLFYEHVHLTPAGNYLLAKTILSRISEEPLPSRTECANAIGLTAWDEFRMRDEMFQFMARPPFTAQFDHAARQQTALKSLEDFRANTLGDALKSGSAIYEAALKRAPGDWQLHDKFAGLLFERREYESAISNWERVLERFPGDPDTLVRTGNALLRLGKPGEASGRFRDALVRRPDLPEARKGLGDVFLLEKKFPEAITEFDTALRRKPDYPEACNNLGAARLATKDLDGAIAAFERAVELRPDASAHLNLAGVFARRGKYDEAISEYRAALRLKPSDSTAHSNLGIVLATTGKLDEAATALREAIRVNEGNQKAHAALARILAMQGRPEEAAVHQQRANALRE